MFSENRYFNLQYVAKKVFHNFLLKNFLNCFSHKGIYIIILNILFYRRRESKYLSVSSSLIFPSITDVTLHRDKFFFRTDVSSTCFTANICIIREDDSLLCEDADINNNLIRLHVSDFNYTNFCGNLTFEINMMKMGKYKLLFVGFATMIIF